MPACTYFNERDIELGDEQCYHDPEIKDWLKEAQKVCPQLHVIPKTYEERKLFRKSKFQTYYTILMETIKPEYQVISLGCAITIDVLTAYLIGIVNGGDSTKKGCNCSKWR